MQEADLAEMFASGSAMGSWLRDKVGITNRSREVGRGTYGAVFKAVCPAFGRQLAVKVQMCRPIDAKSLRDEQRCLSLLKNSPHPNVVELLEQFLDEPGGYAALVMPAGMCDLRKFQRIANDELPADLVVSLSQDLCRGLRHIHGFSILHRDIKPANCLVFIGSTSTTLKLSDFGNSTIRPPSGARTPGHCTAWYRPPEMFEMRARSNKESVGYGAPVDMWSCGCVVGEMILGVILFDGDSELETVGAIAERLGQPGPSDMMSGSLAKLRALKSTNLAPRPKLHGLDLPIGRRALAAGMDLARSCLCWHPVRRITAAECMQHAFFQNAGAAAAANVVSAGERKQPGAASGEQPAAAAVGSSAAEPAAVTSARSDEADRSCDKADVSMPGPQSTLPRLKCAAEGPCQCQGYCARRHGAGKCLGSRLAGSAFCNNCTCVCVEVGAGSSRGRCLCCRSRSEYCYRHLYLSMPRELQVVRHLGQEGLLQQMMPCDVEQLLASRAKFGKDLVLQFIAAWLKEPAAIKALAKFKPNGTVYTARELMGTLHQVSRPEVF
jgi:Protein kinase domain